MRYLHPYLAYRDIDWDRALVDALPRIRDAESSEEYAAAVQSMLDALGDPVTRVLPEKDEQEAPARPPAAPAPACGRAGTRCWSGCCRMSSGRWPRSRIPEAVRVQWD